MIAADLHMGRARVGLRWHIPVRAAVWPAKAVQNRSIRFCRTHVRAFSSHPKIKNPARAGLYILAERVGFEPTNPVKGLRFSRPVHSTALPPLRIRGAIVQPRHQAASVSLTTIAFAIVSPRSRLATDQRLIFPETYLNEPNFHYHRQQLRPVRRCQ
jgi:hypothetical protein